MATVLTHVDVNGTQIRHRERSALATVVAQLVALANNLRCPEDGLVDVASQSGIDSIEAFLRAMYAICNRMAVVAAPRTYRNALPRHTVTDWIDQECPYSVRIIIPTFDGALYFNGRGYPLSTAAVAFSGQLHLSVEEVCQLFDRLHATPLEEWAATDLVELRSSLAHFDNAWAVYEEQFFIELPDIETNARAALVEAMDIVSELDHVASSSGLEVRQRDLKRHPELLRLHRCLIDSITRLNSVANPGSIEHSFGPALLQRIEEEVDEALRQDQAPRRYARASFLLSTRAAIAWDDLCCYLYQARPSQHLLCTELSRNADLVGHLTAWESSWAWALAYVADQGGLRALSSLCEYIRAAGALVPALQVMLDEQSAELSTLLPSLVWLGFLDDPSQIGPLLAPLLPHRLGEPGRRSQAETMQRLDPELAAFADHYRQTRVLFLAESAATEAENDDVLAVLTRRIVMGLEDESAFHAQLGSRASESCKDFLLQLERWSMELQTRRPADWKQLWALLMTCLDPNAPPLRA